MADQLQEFLARPPVRPELMPLLAQVWNQPESFGGPMEELVAEMGRRLMRARAEEQQAGAAFQAERAAPTPRISALGEALARAGGRAIGGLRGDESGPQLAEQLLQRENQDLLQRRKENLIALEDAYKRAADRAAQMGDLETQIKFTNARQGALDKREAINKILLASAQSEIEASTRERLAQIEVAGARELAGIKSGFDIQLERVRQAGDERTEYIRQGLDPDDPTQPLVGSKAQRITQAKLQGFLDANQWANALARITSQVYKQRFGGGFAHDLPTLRTRVLNELPPEISYAGNPDGWIEQMLNLRNPDNPQKFLFERDSKGVLKPQEMTRLKAYMKRYFPDWVAPVSAVGR